MTLESFRATKREAEERLVYGGDLDLMIERTANWPEVPSPYTRPGEPAYYLLLDRSEFFSDDLPALEARLYEWAASEGLFEDASFEARP